MSNGVEGPGPVSNTGKGTGHISNIDKGRALRKKQDFGKNIWGETRPVTNIVAVH